MRSKNYSVRIIGLLALGFLVVNLATPWGPTEALAQGEPIIVFQLPEGTPRYTATADPIEPPITIDVQVDFPEASTPCAGTPLPVEPTSLVVTVNQQLDGAVLDSWPVDTSGWTWNTENNNVTGQVTIGGETNGQGRSLYGVQVCIANSSASACATKEIRMEYPVSGFTAGLYNTKGKNFSQTGAGCSLIPSIGLPFINENMATTEFLTIVPSGSEIAGGSAEAEFIGIPLIGSITLGALLDPVDNNVDLQEVGVSGIDLSGIGLPGTNCSISGKADGMLMGEVSPGLDLDGSIRVYDITLGPGGGTGTCDLVAAPTCQLNISFDGNLP